MPQLYIGLAIRIQECSPFVQSVISLYDNKIEDPSIMKAYPDRLETVLDKKELVVTCTFFFTFPIMFSKGLVLFKLCFTK